MFFSSNDFKKNLKLQIKDFKQKAKNRKITANQEKKNKKHLKNCLKQLLRLPRFNEDGRHVARANETIRIRKLIEVMRAATFPNLTLGILFSFLIGFTSVTGFEG